jgi:hypothetical protein
VSLRGAEEDKYCAIDVTRMGQDGGLAHILEEVEVSRAIFELYEGAVVCPGMTMWNVLLTFLSIIVYPPGPHIPGELYELWSPGLLTQLCAGS